MKAMARDVAQRFQTCEEFMQALRDYQVGRGITAADLSGQLPVLNASAAVARVSGMTNRAAAADGGHTHRCAAAQHR